MTQAGPRTVLLGNVTGPIRKEVLSSGVVKLVECNLELLGAIFDIIQGETAQLWNQFRGKQNRKPKANLLQHWSNPNASNAPMDSLVYKPIDFLLLCKLVGVGFLFSSVQFSHPVTSDSLQSHGLQHASLPCPSPTLAACSDSHPLSQWCHSNEYLRLISFRIDLFDLPAVQGTLNSLLQCYSSKPSILWCLLFFMVQLSHPYMTTGKTIALTRQTFVGKVRSLIFNMLSRLVITFPPRSQMSFNFMAGSHHLQWFWSPRK